jgi:hypothetical protein
MWYLYTMEFYSATRKNEIMSFTGNGWNWRTGSPLKWSKPEGQKVYVVSHMWNIDLMQMQQNYETLAILMGTHILER